MCGCRFFHFLSRNSSPSKWAATRLHSQLLHRYARILIHNHNPMDNFSWHLCDRGMNLTLKKTRYGFRGSRQTSQSCWRIELTFSVEGGSTGNYPTIYYAPPFLISTARHIRWITPSLDAYFFQPSFYQSFFSFPYCLRFRTLRSRPVQFQNHRWTGAWK